MVLNSRTSARFVLRYSLAAAASASIFAAVAQAQFLPETVLIDSFEGGVSAWEANTGTTNNLYLNHAQSTVLPTRGANSMLLDLYGTHQRNTADPRAGASGWGVTRTVSATDPDLALYNAFNAVAANPSLWNLEFDIGLNAASWADILVPTGPPVSTSGGWSFLSLGFNNDGGFSQIGTISPSLVNQQGRFKVRVGMEQLTTWTQNSSYYQFLIGANNRFVPGTTISPPPTTTPGPPPVGTAAKYFIDNIRFKPKAPIVPNTLFSWETPDNPATPTVNEAFEGWSDAGLNAPDPELMTPGDAYAHVHSIGTTGATHGTKALTIDTTVQDPNYVNPLGFPQSYRFHWGSNMVLNSDTNPDPDVVTVDPTIQARITDIATKINKASSISFDLTFSDPATSPINPVFTLPGFLLFHLHISDSRGTFFQADLSSIVNDGATAQALLLTDDPREPLTITVPITQFTDLGATQLGPLANAKLQADSTFLRIGLAVNADGPAIIHMDNFRVNIETSLDADFDNDGDVDGADLPIWRTAMQNGTEAGDANDDGLSNGADFLIWQQQLGNDATPASPASGAVPEPASVWLAACSLAGAIAARRRSGRAA